MSDSSGIESSSTIHQIVDDAGNPSIAAHTEPLWVDRTATNVFSFPTSGNKIQLFMTGWLEAAARNTDGYLCSDEKYDRKGKAIYLYRKSIFRFRFR